MSAATVSAIGAILLPIFAWLIINANWSFYIPLLNISYTPWRLYIVVCGIPGFLCGLAFFKLPESPKFLISVGKYKEAIRILIETMGIDDVETFAQVIELQEHKGLTPIEEEAPENRSVQIMKDMWYNTKLLFNQKYLKITFLTCYVQVITFATSLGMYVWFPDILNSVIEFTNENANTSSTICSIYKDKLHRIFNETDVVLEDCNNKFEISTYKYTLITDTTIIIGFGITTFIISKIPNNLMICK